MSNTSSQTNESLPTSDRRRHARQRIKSLAYLDLGRDNGGIVLNISEGGLAVQAAGIVAVDSDLQMRLRLPESEQPLEATGQLAWTSESKREAGIHFIDLPAAARKQIEQWLSKQASGAESRTDEGSVREMSKQVLEIPPRRGPKESVAETAMISGMTSEEFDAMFPSEKNPASSREFELRAARFPESFPASARPHLSVMPPEGAAQDREEAKRLTIDSTFSNGGQAETTTGKSPEQPGPPMSSSAVPTSTIHNDAIKSEGFLNPVVAESGIRAQPNSFLPTSFSRVVAQTPAAQDALPPVSQGEDAIPESAAAPAFTEPQSASLSVDHGIAPPRAIDGGTPKALEAETTAPSNPAALPSSVEPDAARPANEGASESRAGENSLLEDRPPAVETSSSAAMIRDLRATLNRAAAIHKSALRHKVAKQESEAIPSSDSAAIVPPVVAPPVANGPTVSPILSPTSLPSPNLGQHTPDQLDVLPLMTEISPDAAISLESDKQPHEFNEEVVNFARNSRPLSRVRWKPTTTLILIFLVLLAIGLSFNRATFERLRGSTSPLAKSTVFQPTPPAADNALNVPEAEHENSEMRRENRGALASAGTTITAPARRQQMPRTSGSPLAPQKFYAPVLSPPIVANREVQAGAQKEESPPAIPAQPDKASTDSWGIPAPSSWDGAPKLAPPQPTTQIAGQGDRVIACSLLYRVEPVYPAEAVQKQIEGTVKLRAVIGRDGRVMGLGLVSGPQSLVPAAISAAREWRYIPALLNGEPVESETDIAIEFQLSHEADR